jgi:hypothetical protein
MGDRGQVRIIGTYGSEKDLYFYTHWTASRLPEIVATALDRGRGRWNDDEYLNRIVFSEMIKDQVLDEIGYGIGLNEHGDVWRIVEINHFNKTVSVKHVEYFENDYLNAFWIYDEESVKYEDFISLHAMHAS